MLIKQIPNGKRPRQYKLNKCQMVGGTKLTSYSILRFAIFWGKASDALNTLSKYINKFIRKPLGKAIQITYCGLL